MRCYLYGCNNYSYHKQWPHSVGCNICMGPEAFCSDNYLIFSQEMSLCMLMKFASTEGKFPLQKLDWCEHYSFPRELIQVRHSLNYELLLPLIMLRPGQVVW